MLNAYRNIISESKDLKSIAAALFGIVPSEVSFGAEIFLESYLEHCKHSKSGSLDLHIVCYNHVTFTSTKDCIFNYVKSRKEDPVSDSQTKQQKPEPATEAKEDFKTYQNDFDDIPDDGDCVICMDKKTDPVKLSCGHWFCKECIEQQFTVKKACPTCGKVHGIITGDQPPGTMKVTSDKYQRCEGYPSVGKISIRYNFLSGKQGKEHPNPGQRYEGITRTAYVPANKQGQDVCRMLKVAFSRKLVFTIGNSRTTGKEGVITWNGIHHKTDWRPYSQ